MIQEQSKASDLVVTAHPRRGARVFGLFVASMFLMACFLFSLAYGETRIPLEAVVDAFFNQEDSFEQIAVRTVRLPRTLIAMLVGAALAVAGGIMQGITRNTLASPSILAVNAGASLAVTLAVVYLNAEGISSFTWFAFAGGSIAAVIVYILASAGSGGATPIKLALAGAAFSMFLGALTSMVLIANERAMEEVRYWLVGDVIGRDISLVQEAAPYFFVTMTVALLLSRQITTISLGDDLAQGLGQNATRVRLAAAIAAVGLTGTSVALAGPIGFIGLIIPNVVRLIIGGDYRWILPYAAAGGAGLFLCADIASRMLVREGLFIGHIPVGLITPLLGVPVFVFFARRMIR